MGSVHHVLFMGLLLMRPAWQALLFPLSLMLLTTCLESSGADQTPRLTGDDEEGWRDNFELHPTPDNIPAVTDARFIIKDESQGTLDWMLAGLRGGHLVGVEDGSHRDMIGDVRDMAVGDSLLYYVDRSYTHIRAYDFEGHLANIIGGPGGGPGEFSLLRKVTVTGAGSDVHVVAGSAARTVSVFRRTLDGNHEFQTSFHVTAKNLNSDLCAMRGHVYTAGYAEELDGVIHKHTLAGEYVASFGARYNNPHLILRLKMAEGGYMECNETHGVLLYTQPNAPIATAYTETGDMIWRVRFADARIAPKGARYVDAGQVGVGSIPPLVGESGQIVTIGGAHGDSFWLARFERLNEGRSHSAMHFYKVDVVSGQGQYMGRHRINRELPVRIVRAIDQERVYTVRTTPYPQLGIHSIQDTAR